MTNPHIGLTFDDLLAEEDLLKEVEAIAIKRILMRQVRGGDAGPAANQEGDSRANGHQQRATV